MYTHLRVYPPLRQVLSRYDGTRTQWQAGTHRQAHCDLEPPVVVLAGCGIPLLRILFVNDSFHMVAVDVVS
jgi:hypothetical protein